MNRDERAPSAADRLQPALLDRLVDDDPTHPSAPDTRRALTRRQLRDAVLRDLRWLFNATQPNPQWEQQRPAIAGTVLNFGLPPLAGRRASELDVHALERTIAQAIRRFEPRILPATLAVRAIETDSVVETHNLIEFEIRGELWGQPLPLAVLLRTRLDLEAGQVDVADASAPERARR